MSDLNTRVNQIAEYSWLKLAARLALPAIAFVGFEAWSDLKAQGNDINSILRNQAVAEQKIDNAVQRIQNLEEWQKKITYGSQ